MFSKKTDKHTAANKRKALFITLLLHLGILGAIAFHSSKTSNSIEKTEQAEVQNKHQNIDSKKSKKVSSKYQKAKTTLAKK